MKLLYSLRYAAFLMLMATASFGQNLLKGIVQDASTKTPLVGVSIQVKGKQIGTVSDRNGAFELRLATPPPYVLVASSVGFQALEQTVNDMNKPLTINLSEAVIQAQEVVVSASRVEESILKSVATIEKMDIRAIRETPALNFYDAIRNLKGVDFTTNSVFFNAINIRGANATGNTRMVQLIDGMDNQAPGLNFAIGNLVGISELDLESVEVVPGASSALYGPAAMNGAIILKSKSPFLYRGLSTNLKIGAMNASNRTARDGSPLGTTPLHDYSLRYAKAFGDKWAFKINVSYQQAQDWQANDPADISYRNGFNFETGTRLNNPGYNGINSYADDISANLTALRPALNQLLGLPTTALPSSVVPLVQGIKQVSQLTGVPTATLVNEFVPSVTVSRTGFNELDLADYNSRNLKFNAAFHYRLSPKAELIVQGSHGSGTTVYTASDRYFIKNFSMGQYKAELKGSNYFVRAYTSQERSGDTYAIGIQMSLLNEVWKPSFDGTSLQTLAASWFPQYGLTYAGGALQTFVSAFQQALAGGQSAQQAYANAIAAKNAASATFHTTARQFADKERPLPGTPAFRELADQIAQRPIPKGARFMDKTNLYHGEFMYQFDKIKFADLLVGGSYRQYQLNSDGTLFAKNPETGKEFIIQEVGAYGQAIKTFWKERIKMVAGLRYDKNLRLKGQLTPRVGMVLSPRPNSNVRISYQTGFRLPTTQEQYIDLVVPGQHNLGGVEAVVDKYDLDGKAYTLVSYNAGKPEVFQFQDLRPETTRVLEIGYKDFFWNRVFFDILYYRSTFPNRIGSVDVIKVKPDGSTETFSIVQAYPNQTYQQGLAASVEVLLPLKFSLSANYSRDVVDAGLRTTSTRVIVGSNGVVITDIPPRNRFNVSLLNRDLFKTGISFNVALRYQAPAANFTSIVTGPVRTNPNQPFLPAQTIIDAQLSKKISSLGMLVKLGGTNLGGRVYRTTIGNPYVGTMLYASFTFDELIK
jgi:iron complex outermembrane recepter protein